MYLSILGKPTDKDLERYPAIHLTGPCELDSSVLDYTHPSGDGEPPWSNDPDERFAFDPSFDDFGDNTKRAIQTLSILDDSSSAFTSCSTLMMNQHVFRANQHDVSPETPDNEKSRPYFGWVNDDTVQETMEQSTQLGVSLPVGSSQVLFPMCTLETPQKLQYKFFSLDFGYFYFSAFSQTMSFSFIFVFASSFIVWIFVSCQLKHP